MIRAAAAGCLAVLASACLPIPYKDQVWKGAPASEDGQQTAKLDERLVIGDLVRVRTKEGKTHIFRVYKIEETAFYGIARDRNKYRIGYAALASMEVRRTETAVGWVTVPVGISLGNFGGLSSGSAGVLTPGLVALLLAAGVGRRRLEGRRRHYLDSMGHRR